MLYKSNNYTPDKLLSPIHKKLIVGLHILIDKFYNLFDLQECMFGCIIFLQANIFSEILFAYYKGGKGYGT